MNYDPLKKPKFNEQPDYSHPFCRGLVGWWMLNEPGGNTAHDLSPGRLNPGTLVGPTWKDGALEFDGDDYVKIIDDASLKPVDEVSVAGWAKRIASDGTGIIAKWKAGGLSYMIYNSTANGKSRFYIDSNYAESTSLLQYSPYPLWQHIAGTYDGSDIKIYINGILEDSTERDGTIPSGTNPLEFGRYAENSDYAFAGHIDDIRIYNRALNEAQVNALFVNSLSGEYKEFPKPVVYFLPPVVGGLSIPVAMRHYRNLRVG